MNREEYLLKLEEELLLTKSKAQVITLYLDALEEIERLNNIIDELHILFIEFDRNVMRRKYVDANMINLEIKAKLRELKEGK